MKERIEPGQALRCVLMLAMLCVPAVNALGATTDAASQSSSAEPVLPDSEDVIVMGHRLHAIEVEKIARAITAPGRLYQEPLAQFQEPVCPAVIGMAGDYAAAIVKRIRYDAERAKIRVAPPFCSANLVVVFVVNGQAAMRNLTRNGPWLFGDLRRDAIQDLPDDPVFKRLVADPGPVHAWVNTETRSAMGDRLGGGDQTSEPSTLHISGGTSRITMEARKDIVGSLVVIDRGAVAGLETNQVADYAAMRGLAQTRPPAQAGSLGTILSLFEAGADAPTELTEFDLAYLRMLYGTRPNIVGAMKIGSVAAALRKGGR